MENKSKKTSLIVKIFIFIVIIIILSVLVIYEIYIRNVSIPNAELSKICEEKILIGMAKEDVINIMSIENIRTEVVVNESSSHIFFSYFAKEVAFWDLQPVIDFKNNKVSSKDCYWGF